MRQKVREKVQKIGLQKRFVRRGGDVVHDEVSDFLLRLRQSGQAMHQSQQRGTTMQKPGLQRQEELQQKRWQMHSADHLRGLHCSIHQKMPKNLQKRMQNLWLP